MGATHKKLEQQLTEIETYISDKDLKKPAVSEASVGWHLSHNLKVFNGICEALHSSKPEDYKREFSLSKTLVLFTGHIPRGKAKSPKRVLPPGEITEEGLKQQLKEARMQLNQFDSLNKQQYFEHPYFKKLNKKESKVFLEIHTRHHLKIIRDILVVKHR